MRSALIFAVLIAVHAAAWGQQSGPLAQGGDCTGASLCGGDAAGPGIDDLRRALREQVQPQTSAPATDAAPATGAATANAVAAGARLHLRMVGDAVAMQVGAGSNATVSDLRDQGLSGNESYTDRSLAMAMQALGLTADAAATARIPDLALLATACGALLPTERVSLYGPAVADQICLEGSHSLRMPGQEFVLHDAISRFKAQGLPLLATRAPRLPLALLVEVAVRFDAWDPVKGGFPMSGDAPVLFGNRMQFAWPKVFPANEAEARAFAASAARRASPGTGADYQGLLGIPVTLTGVRSAPGGRAGEPTVISGQSGLPGGLEWTFEIGEPVLFARDGTHRVLYRYGSSLAFPTPSMGTPAAAAPRLTGPLRLSGETPLLVGLRSNVPGLPPPDWTQSAVDRLSLEGPLRQDPAWSRRDPWGVFFVTDPMRGYGAVSPAEADAFKAWTIKRAAALPDVIQIDQDMPAAAGPARVKVLARQTSSSWLGPEPTDLMRRLPPRLQQLGIDPSMILPLQLSYSPAASSVRIPVVLAVPKPAGEYVLEAPSGIPAPPPNGDSKSSNLPSLAVEARLEGIDLIPGGPQTGGPALLLRLQPIAATVRSAASVVASIRFPVMAWPSPPPPPAPAPVVPPVVAAPAAPPPPDAEQLFLAGPYGPDLLGIHVGQTIADAEAVIRAHMHVARVLKTENAAGAPASLQGTLFISDDRATSYFSEQIAIFAPPPVAGDKQAGKVVAAWRIFYVDDGFRPQAIAAMRQKYGEPNPVLSFPAQPAWGTGPSSSCVTYGGDRQPRWLEDGQPLARKPGNNPQQVSVPDITVEPADKKLEQCGPSIAGRTDGPESMADMRPLGRISTFLLDRGLLVRLAPRWMARTPTPAAIKF